MRAGYGGASLAGLGLRVFTTVRGGAGEPEHRLPLEAAPRGCLLRDGRLHDARHTATVLLILGVPERAVMDLVGWSITAMAARYQHITRSIRGDVTQRVGGLLWGTK